MKTIRSLLKRIALCLAAAAVCGCAVLADPPAGPDAAREKLIQLERARERLEIGRPTAREEKQPLVFVHYMPWFEAPEFSDNYGWHWHMGYFDPWEPDETGRSPIASHYYPLTGPYDSRDPSVLEYQVMLMKLAGIDGIIFDWYGIEKALDYPFVHEATIAMIEVAVRAGLRYAICYEDQSIGKAVEAGVLTRDTALEAGKKVMRWMDEYWFSDPAYYRIQDRPVLLDFGPQYFLNPADWTAIFAEADPAPYFVTLDDHMERTADSWYPWSPMWASVGGTLTYLRLVQYLNGFYAEHIDRPHLIATALPGFHDIYREAGVSAGYGFLDDAEGEVFRLTLDAAAAALPDAIQIQTWNDYGEGTMVEPTEERGYRELLTLQEFEKRYDPAFPYTEADLEIPIELYRLRSSSGAPDGIEKAVQDALTALASGDAAAFRSAAASPAFRSSDRSFSCYGACPGPYGPGSNTFEGGFAV